MSSNFIRPTAIPQLQNMGLNPAATMINTGITTAVGADQREKDRRMDLIRSILGGGVDVGTQLLRNKGNLDVAESNQANALLLEQFRMPNRNLQTASRFFEAAKAAADAGDFNRQQQLNKMGQNTIDQALGMGQGLLGEQTDMSKPPLGNLPQGSPQDIEQLPGVAQSQGVDTTKPIGGTVSNINPNLPFSSQKMVSEAQKKRAEAAKASFNVSTLQSIQEAQNAPDGAELVGAGGVKFKGLKVNPNIKSLLEASSGQSANDPKALSEAKIENARNTRAILNVSKLLGDVEPLVTSDFGSDLLNRLGTGSSIGLRLAEMAGGVPKDRIKQFYKAKAANDQLEGLIPVLARKVSGEKGALREEDVARAKGLIPLVTDPPAVFQRKKELFSNSVLPLLMEDSLKALDPVTFNRVQSEYRKVFGKDFTFDEDVVNTVRNQPEQKTLNTKATQAQGQFIDEAKRSELLKLLPGVFNGN